MWICIAMAMAMAVLSNWILFSLHFFFRPLSTVISVIIRMSLNCVNGDMMLMRLVCALNGSIWNICFDCKHFKIKIILKKFFFFLAHTNDKIRNCTTYTQWWSVFDDDDDDFFTFTSKQWEDSQVTIIWIAFSLLFFFGGCLLIGLHWPHTQSNHHHHHHHHYRHQHRRHHRPLNYKIKIKYFGSFVCGRIWKIKKKLFFPFQSFFIGKPDQFESRQKKIEFYF